MAGIVNITKMGLENFSRFGKLIGTSKKTGTKVYEQLYDGISHGQRRVLTAVDKGGNVTKEVIHCFTPKGKVITSRNYKTGEEFMMRKERNSLYIDKGDVNQIEKIKIEGLGKDKDYVFGSYRFQNLQEGKDLMCDYNSCYSLGELVVNAKQVKDGKEVPYQLTDELTLPKRFVMHRSKQSDGIDKNLGKVLSEYFFKFFAKFSK